MSGTEATILPTLPEEKRVRYDYIDPIRMAHSAKLSKMIKKRVFTKEHDNLQRVSDFYMYTHSGNDYDTVDGGH